MPGDMRMKPGHSPTIKMFTGRGERYAEDCALKYEQIVWDSYLKKFDLG